MPTRRLVVCFDGTWNSPDKGKNPTNVVKLVRAIRNLDPQGVTQATFYDKGVGTAGGMDRITGGGLGAGLNANVVDGYRFLANNHEPGDEIYLFGFSRGAYTARSLAGLIGLCGMLHPSALGAGLKAALEVYQDKEQTRDAKRERIASLALPGNPRARIRCVGVWDTVGSLGIPGDLGRRLLGDRVYFQDVQLGTHIDVALHAVAIDEKRSAFAPTLWVSPTGSPSPAQIVEQVWFPGVHSNIGGSYDDARLSDIAFEWMVRRVGATTDLAFDVAYLDKEVQPSPEGKGVESRTLLYKDSVAYPYQRIIAGAIPDGSRVGDWFRSTFPSLDRRSLPPEGLHPINERLHVAALERWRLDRVRHDCPSSSDCAPIPYRPTNLAAAIRAHQAGKRLTVVGADGRALPENAIPWPPASEL